MYKYLSIPLINHRSFRCR